MAKNEPWWGEFSYNIGQARKWTVGNKSIFIQRQQSQWLTWHEKNELTNPENGQQLVMEVLDSVNRSNDSDLVRHLQACSSDNIKIIPALADRSVVARPSVPLHLLSSEQILIYVSTPVWLTARTPDDSQILDLPFFRPSDSWFGPSTMSGEICYAKYTDAKLDIAQIEPRSHRAVTPIRIHNQKKEPMAIERINVPIPFLHLYADEKHQFWTEAVTLVCEEDGDFAEIQFDKRPPDVAEKMTTVAQPRQLSDQNKLIRNIGNLFA